MTARGLNSEMKKWNAVLAIYIKVLQNAFTVFPSSSFLRVYCLKKKKNQGHRILCTGFGSVSSGMGQLLRSKMTQPLRKKEKARTCEGEGSRGGVKNCQGFLNFAFDPFMETTFSIY